MKITINEDSIKALRSDINSANLSYETILGLVNQAKNIVNDISSICDTHINSLEDAFFQLENNIIIISGPVEKISILLNNYADAYDEILSFDRIKARGK